jgi:hypothetical protein
MKKLIKNLDLKEKSMSARLAFAHTRDIYLNAS